MTTAEKAKGAAAGRRVMARRLRPCGTPAAYNRHRYRDEPIDDACAQARRRSAWTLRREDYRWLRSNGEPIEAAAQRIGITEKTAKRWEAAA